MTDLKNKLGNGEPDSLLFAQDYETATKEALGILQKSVAEVYTTAFKTRQEMINNEKEFDVDYHEIEREGEFLRNEISAEGKEKQLEIAHQKERLMRELESEGYLNDLCHENQMENIRSDILEKEQIEKTETELVIKAIEEISRQQELETRLSLEKGEILKKEQLTQIENECNDEMEKMKRKFEIEKAFEESRLRKAIADEEKVREEIRKKKSSRDDFVGINVEGRRENSECGVNYDTFSNSTESSVGRRKNKEGQLIPNEPDISDYERKEKKEDEGWWNWAFWICRSLCTSCKSAVCFTIVLLYLVVTRLMTRQREE